MRFARLLIAVLTLGLPSQLQAQASVYELQAGLGYSRLFDAGGVSFAAAVDRSLSPATAGVLHGLGGTFWYTRTGIASRPDDPESRTTVGLGARYRLTLPGSQSVRPFLAVPLQALYSQIPESDRVDLLSGSLAAQSVPEAEDSYIPAEDLVGGNLGWGAGLELGLRVQVGGRLSGQTSVQGLYQDIYEDSSRHSAWSWHAGISYGL
jgi:hypothetical protein